MERSSWYFRTVKLNETFGGATADIGLQRKRSGIKFSAQNGIARLSQDSLAGLDRNDGRLIRGGREL